MPLECGNGTERDVIALISFVANFGFDELVANSTAEENGGMGVSCGLVNRLTDGHFPSAVKLSLLLRLNDVSDANLILLPTSDGPVSHSDNPPATLGSGRQPYRVPGSLSSSSSTTQM